DAVPEEVLTRILGAAHAAPSVGHSQPWRFVVVSDPMMRQRAAWMADQERLAQAAQLEPDASRQLLDLQLEGIREAPLGIVVCCDRRSPPAGVLGRATFVDADIWSCACAIENLWLAARVEGVGVGWVTLFQPAELAALVGLPDGVVTLGWLCVGWPDERPPFPGLERAGWSTRMPLSDVVIRERWPAHDVAAPSSRLVSPSAQAVVGVRDEADTLLTPMESLGQLDRAVNKVVALGRGGVTTGCLMLVAGDHLVADLGVSAYRREVGRDVLAAARAGEALGVVAARANSLDWVVVDAGCSDGDLLHRDALHTDHVRSLLAEGRVAGRDAAARGVVAVGEIGIGNTTVASALTAVLLGIDPAVTVGLGAGADSTMADRKVEVVTQAIKRASELHGASLADPVVAFGALGGPEFAYLTGVILGVAEAGQVVVLDGLATGVAALVACLLEPAVTASLIAGQRSRERAHPLVLARLGLEPLLDLRLRAGEGVGASLATGMLLKALQMRRDTARVEGSPTPTDGTH
ncbi:MAG: cob(II)yrinic acid a,c-diamide reductase, partial [Acidimicrobiia bacterium]|nr:cob(II)yrinic acid a,c-diamide reductase [Acidimicrobiia bacterium]